MKHVINNPGGRKKLSAEKLMGNPIPVRFNLRQRTRLEMKVAKANMPLSVYLREAGLKAVVRQRVTGELMKVIRDLNNLGTNLNIIAKGVASHRFDPFCQECREAVRGVNEVLHKARVLIKEKEDEENGATLE